MLVLSRKMHESIIIDGDIEVSILAIKGTTVRLGITAEGRTIDRQEIHNDKFRKAKESEVSS